MKAFLNNTLIAESDKTIEIENNHYFPPESIFTEYFQLSTEHTDCEWKGRASYFNLQVRDTTDADAAWFYPHPKPEAAQIKNYVAFWKDVEVKNE